MAKRKAQKRFPKSPIVIALLILAFLIFAWQSGYFDVDAPDTQPPKQTTTEPAPETTTAPVPPVDEAATMELHVIDIGQGDSLLVKTADGFILIDTGDKINKYEQALRTYLDKEGVKTLEYVIFTHMDSDHIGNAVAVLEGYEVKNIIMPNLDESDIPTTNVFENMIAAIEADETAQVIAAMPGREYLLGGMKMTVLGPLGDDYPSGDRNNYSVCVRLDFGETSFLLTGDAEERAEKEMLARYTNGELDCDFFKAGHHGANTSNTAAFLAAITPKYVAVSCGEGNKYLHPHTEALERFGEIGATVWRTDLDGDLVFVSDGKTITKE